MILRFLSMTALPALALFLMATVSHSETLSAGGVFRLHIPIEPASLDPALVQTTDASYFLNNVMRGLYSYDNEKGLVLEGAKFCTFLNPLKMSCELATDREWSDGSKIVADDYVRAFRRLVATNGKNAAIELLKNLKNTQKVHGGKAAPDQLGIRSINAARIEFEFEKPDPEFLYKLCSSVLVPVKSESFPAREKSPEVVVNGPYRVVSWTKGRRVRLESNEHYKTQGDAKARPPVEILFIEDDETGFNLYEQGELTFLRRLPSTLIPKMKARADFHQIPVARFDYLGFGPELDQQPFLREALAYSLDFAELARIYDALGIPGCPSLPRHLMDNEPCIKFDLTRAKRALAQVRNEVKSKRFKLGFSKLGGDDIKKGAEWEQAQWKKNLGFTFDLESSEQGVYLAKLRENPPSVFRKGIGLERPTCLAALETFAEGGSENFIHFKDAKYETIVSEIVKEKSEAKKAKLCTQGIQILLDSHRILPLGRIHFTLLARPDFKGWSLNEMNQLDLSRLHL
jgi:oligopeptide transport system substrate-binding protein